MERQADTQYPILEQLRRRWSPYTFSDRPVEPQKLRCLLEAARWAASSFNEQPWRFILATAENPAEFDKAVTCLVEANQAWARHAPVLMFCLTRNTFTRNDKPNRVALHDLGLAMGNLSIQAAAIGLSVHQMAGIDADRIVNTYAVPDGYTPQTAAAIGYQGDNAELDPQIRQRDQGPRTRNPFDDFVFAGRFGDATDLF